MNNGLLSWFSDTLQKETEEILQTKHGSKSQLAGDRPVGSTPSHIFNYSKSCYVVVLALNVFL